MKFGGSSLADAGHIRAAARRVEAAYRDGRQVVCVVSAMADTTDELVRLARSVRAEPEARELDQIMATGEAVSAALTAMALTDLGVPASALTGGQAGIRTDGTFGAARVLEVRPDRVLEALDTAGVVVVAGFQGADRHGDVTTLGRGGSDATAVLLAAALGTERCEIRTDVDGVYTADPRLAPGARKLSRVGYHAMLRMAEAGARVLQPRAVRLARDLAVPLHVRSSFDDTQGTWVGALREAPWHRVLCVAHIREQGRIAVLAAEPDGGPELAAAATAVLKEHDIPVLRTDGSRADEAVVFVGSGDVDAAVRVLHADLAHEDRVEHSLAQLA